MYPKPQNNNFFHSPHINFTDLPTKIILLKNNNILYLVGDVKRNGWSMSTKMTIYCIYTLVSDAAYSVQLLANKMFTIS